MPQLKIEFVHAEKAKYFQKRMNMHFMYLVYINANNVNHWHAACHMHKVFELGFILVLHLEPITVFTV